MNSREFDSMLDDLLRQALSPFAEAEPPARVWRHVLRTVRAIRAGFAFGGLSMALSRWVGWLLPAGEGNVMAVPLFSNRSYYVDSSGRGLPSPFWDIALTQMFDLRLAS